MGNWTVQGRKASGNIHTSYCIHTASPNIVWDFALIIADAIPEKLQEFFSGYVNCGLTPNLFIVFRDTFIHNLVK